MQRYFVSPELMEDQICYIHGQDAHHIGHVMRFQTGDELICCNGEGRTVLAQISKISKDSVECRIMKEFLHERELPITISIAQGLPKGDKFEWVIQKGTELGAHRFIPYSSLRTIVRYDSKKEQKKRDRWEKIIKEAAEQSHRDRLPQISSILSWKNLLDMKADCKLVAYEQTAEDKMVGPSSFYQALSSVKQGGHLIVVIGPEGGLDEAEVRQLEDSGFQTISLGKRILRTETASQYVLSSISFYFEQIGGGNGWQQ